MQVAERPLARATRVDTHVPPRNERAQDSRQSSLLSTRQCFYPAPRITRHALASPGQDTRYAQPRRHGPNSHPTTQVPQGLYPSVHLQCRVWTLACGERLFPCRQSIRDPERPGHHLRPWNGTVSWHWAVLRKAQFTVHRERRIGGSGTATRYQSGLPGILIQPARHNVRFATLQC